MGSGGGDVAWLRGRVLVGDGSGDLVRLFGLDLAVLRLGRHGGDVGSGGFRAS